jgi:flavin-dependent dehydrogenase
VIGAGPAGATAARLLADAGWDVALVEKAAFPRRKVCGEFISGSSRALLSGDLVAQACQDSSGPEVKRVGLFIKNLRVEAPMPGRDSCWGRAIARDRLEVALIHEASECGAEVWQPWKVAGLQREAGIHVATITSGDQARKIWARLVIAAAGSWERNSFAGLQALPHDPADLLGFKSHFRGDNLSRDLMPLFAFPGGYGGMVHTGDGQLSLSFCIRRDVLQRCRDAQPAGSAAETALNYIRESCAGVRDTLRGAEPEGHWSAAGPIRPGIRKRYVDGMFFAGNVAGEAHPIVAEGISMAMQSAWMLCRILGEQRDAVLAGQTATTGRIYSRRWRRAFAGRIHAAALFAKIAMHPKADRAARLVELVPQLLTFGARLSGKALQLAG